MKRDFQKKFKKILIVIITIQTFCLSGVNSLWGAEYASLLDAIKATDTPRTYTLDANETSSTVLGDIGGTNSVLTIDGGTGHYGIHNTSTANEVRIFVDNPQTLNLQNLGTYTTTTSSSIVDGMDIITSVAVGNSVDNFGKTTDRAGFIRSAGTTSVTDSVFFNNRGQYGVLQNREEGTMSITGSVFVANNSPQGTVHNDSTNKITQILNSIFYNNIATAPASGSVEVKNRGGSAIYNKITTTIDLISGSQFIGNNTVSTASGQQTGTIYNGGTIGTILNSIFYNNNNQSGSALNNISGGTVNTISGSTFVQNTTDTSGAAIINASGSSIGAITDSLFTANTATGNGGAIYNEGTITDLAGTYTANSATGNGGALYNNGVITNAISATFGGDNAADGNVADLGGAIYNAAGQTVSIDSASIFKNNTATTDGGAIYNAGTIADLAGTYATNSATGNGGAINNTGTITTFAGTYTANSATGNGGALYNNGTITNAISATFGGDNASDGNMADYGGAIYNTAGQTVSVDTASTFKNNGATTDGGAIYNAGTITDLAGTYTSNSAAGNGGAINNVGTITALAGTYTSNNAANGGAIYNTGTISDLSGTYTSNSATTAGGAIYNTGTVTITSSNGADTVFSGNQANSVSNALYNSGTVNMNAGANSSITFDDKITGSNGAIVLGGAGIVEFNDTVAGNSVALNSGTLKLGATNSVEDATNFTASGGLLDLRNSATETYQLGQSTTINGTVDLAIDVNLAGATPVADIISAAGAVSGTGSFVFSSANINLMNDADTQIPLWVQVTDEYLRNNAGLGSNANITITGTESYLVTYETSHESVNAGFLKFEYDSLANAIASTVTEKAYTLGNNAALASTPALGGTNLTVNGNTNGYSITGDTGAGISVGSGQTLSLNDIGVDSSGNVTGAGLNNFSTALTNATGGTINLYNTKLSGNTTDIDNDGTVNMSGTVILDNAQGTGTVNITKDTAGNASSVTVNNSLEQDNITVASENTLTNNNATITANTNLTNAGTITGTGTSSLVINGDSSNTGTIEQGIITTAASVTLTNSGTVTVNGTLNNNGSIVGDSGTLNINATTSNAGTISQGTLATAASTTLTNTGDITVKTTLTNNGTIDNSNTLTLAGTGMTNAGTISNTAGTTNITGTLTNSGTISQKEVSVSAGGALTSDASTLTATDGITNNGTLNLTGGNISSDILSSGGTTNITGNVTNSADHTIANAVDVKNGATLNTNATALTNATNNDGTLELTGGTLAANILGSGSLTVTNSVQNSANITQGSLTVNSGQTLTNNGSTTITAAAGFQNNGTVANNGTISVAGGNNTGSITGSGAFTNSGNFTNSNTITQNTITNTGTITTNSENLVATSGITNNGSLVYNAGSQTVSDITGDGSAGSRVALTTNAPFTIDNTITNTYVDLYNSTVRFGSNGDISGATAFNVNGGGMDMIDGSITSTNLGTVNLNALSNIGIDLDLSTLTSDSFSATVTNNGGIFNVNQVNVFGTTTQDNINIHLGDMTQLGQANVTSETFELPSIMTPIRRIYGRIANGWLTYSGGSGTDVSDFNPAVLATPVISQAGMQTIMANTFQHAYEHADWYTKFPADERFSMSDETSHAVAQGENYGKRILTGQDKDKLAIWFKSYAAFEDVPLRKGPKADVKSYGSLVGIDSTFQDWGRDWYGITTGYVGYNGANTDYPEVSSSMDGGMFGLTQTFYKNNFWTGVTANVGTSFVDTRTMYGRENSTLFATGVGTQTGYNIELGDGNFIIQPIWLMNYSMIKTFDYTNAAGVKIAPKPLHTVQLNPTLRLVGNVKGWQPYASVGMVYNLMNKTSVLANEVELPEMSIKPYMRYDVGVQKAFNDRFSAFVQAMGYNGGRNGIDVVGGIRWAFGKGGHNAGAVQMNPAVENETVSENRQEPQAEGPVVAIGEMQQTPKDIQAPETVEQGSVAQQQNIKTEKPVVNAVVGKEQKENRTEQPIAKEQDIHKDQKVAKAEQPIAKEQDVNQEPSASQAEEPATGTKNGSNWPMVLVCGMILLLIIVMQQRKGK